MTTAIGPVEEERREGKVDFAESMSLQVWITVLREKIAIDDKFLKCSSFLNWGREATRCKRQTFVTFFFHARTEVRGHDLALSTESDGNRT